MDLSAVAGAGMGRRVIMVDRVAVQWKGLEWGGGQLEEI